MRAVDVRTGERRWESAFGAPGSGLPAFGRPQLWSTGSTFLVAGALPRVGAIPPFGELSLSGTKLWQLPLSGISAAPFLMNGYALVPAGNEGATIHFETSVVRLGPHGGSATVLHDASRVLGRWRGGAVVVGGANASLNDDTFLSCEIEVVTVPGARVVLDRVLEPDYDDNRAVSKAPDTPQYGFVTAFEDGYVYASFFGNLYRYDLRGRGDQRPLLLSARTPFVGGPVRGTVYVARRDGVWALTPEHDGITARHVVRTTAKPVAFAARWPYAYVSFTDGAVRGVDVRDGGTVLSGDGCVADQIVADARNAFFKCRGESWRVLAFRAPGL